MIEVAGLAKRFGNNVAVGDLCFTARGRALREADVTSLDGATELAARVDDPESLARALSSRHAAEVSGLRLSIVLPAGDLAPRAVADRDRE